MVKPNPQHDYYQDLEVTPKADQDDIKRQYFKLGRSLRPCCEALQLLTASNSTVVSPGPQPR